jgi:tight adherence protein B
MVGLIIILLFLGTFLVAATAVGLSAVLMQTDRLQAPGMVELGMLGSQPPLLLKQQHLSTISIWDELLVRLDFVAILQVRIAEAGLKWSVGRVTLTMLLLGSATAAILLAADWTPAIVALAAGIAVGFLPYIYILNKRSKRFHKLEEQFPDALDSLSRALRAGQPFGSGMELVANEAPEPLAQEVRRACDEWKLGLPWNEALKNLARRMPIAGVGLFVSAVTLQSRYGGKLNEVLEELAKAIRDSLALHGEVRAISAQGRMTGTVLTILPLAIVGVMLITSPDYIGVLFRYPDGKYLVVAAAVCLVLGHFAIRRIVSVKV